MKLPNLFTFFILIIFIIPNLIQSQSPARDLQDLVGVKGGSAEMDLQNRGYVHIKTEKSGYDVYSYWWQQNSNKCISYYLADGRVQAIVNAPSFDCNKPNNYNSDTNNYSNHISYNHQSHHHSNQTHYSQRDRDDAFERGHSDGLYNKSYHNIYADNDLKNAYTEGYNSGVNNRSNRTSYHSGRGGYSDYARTDDLIGLSVKRTGEVLKNRGFKKLDHMNIDGQKRRHRFFFNQNRSQCIETISRNETTLEVHNSNRCYK